MYGDGIAILAGDGLLTEAFALLAREPRAGADTDLASRKLRVIERIATAAGALGHGRRAGRGSRGSRHDRDPRAHAALARRQRPAGDARDEDRRADSCLGGRRAPSWPAAATRRWPPSTASASEVGLVFQIVDDILDVEGAADQLGKTAGKDAADDKPTYPSLFGLERSRTLAAEGIVRAEAALADAGLLESQLLGIANWVIGRKN